MSTETDIARAFCALIARHTQVVPTTPLVTAPQGSLSVGITPLLNEFGRSRFASGMRLGFYDTLGEGLRTISSVDDAGGTLTLTPSPGTGFTGLVATHTPGTNDPALTPFVYTNLLPYRPGVAAEGMLEMGDPVVWVKVLEGVTCEDGSMMPTTYFDYYSVTVQVERLLNPPSDRYDPEAWNQKVQDDTATDLAAIKTAILSHQSLATDFTPAIAVKFARVGGRGDLMSTKSGLVEQAEGGWHWAGTAQAILTTNARHYP